MRISARILFVAFFVVLGFSFFHSRANAQTTDQMYPAAQPSTAASNFQTTNTDPNVPQNHHTYTQIVLIDMLSAVMCQLTGVDPSNPQQSCLGVDPSTGKVGMAPTQSQVFGQANNQGPQVGGALGVMTNYISALYVPAVSTTQYVQYLSANFGIVKPVDAAGSTNCNNYQFGYGLCGLSPLLTLWTDIRDLAYALLTVLFIAIGIGVMLRFKIDPRTVMTLQNQIPRVIIAILLITFSFAIAGAMIDVMWTVTYVGVNFISNSAPNSKVAVCPNAPQPISHVAETQLLDTPISFVNTMFRADCTGGFDTGFVDLADKVSAALGDLVQQIVHDLLFNTANSSCHLSWWDLTGVGLAITAGKCALQNGALNVLLWLTEFLVKIIIIIAMLIALFRLWFKLIQSYLTFLIFVIMGPIWIVLGLIPGRPMGFEKWFRIIFGNLAVFPLVAFILVFARVIVDAVPAGPSTPNTVFVPPLIGNPSIATFSALMGFGAIMLAPMIPDLIKERMKATGQAKYGAAIAGGLGLAAGAASALPSKSYQHLNKRDQYGNALGPLAQRKDYLAGKIATKAASLPGLGWIGRQHQLHEAAKEGPHALRESSQQQQRYNAARRNWRQQTTPEGQQYRNQREFTRRWRGNHEEWAAAHPDQNPAQSQYRRGNEQPLPPPLPPKEKS